MTNSTRTNHLPFRDKRSDVLFYRDFRFLTVLTGERYLPLPGPPSLSEKGP